MAEPFDGRVAVVTGASRGIGRAAALALGKAGAHVVAVARTVGGLEELDDEIRATGHSATLVPLDLRDGPGIDRLGAALYERWGRLDMFLGNAAILGILTPVPHMDPKVFEDVMAINLTANWRLIRSLDPVLRLSGAGRALFLTSGLSHLRRPYWGAYSASKAALETLVTTYAREMQSTNVRVNLLNPGRLRTRMRAQAMPGEDPMTLRPADAVVPDILRMLSAEFTDNGTLFDFSVGERPADAE